ncbi:MAG: TetR/AcrR family transcriptional regulator [Gordonia sp. (in: high G+C Gram-positive bacteria)]|uniref:TetR/AcrR family transcriptional regulator n=1 Tax=Gordonia sp. (in: high G+C Gram-positive bacteria) TaxID=84139 RepID=UPI0039E3BF74
MHESTSATRSAGGVPGSRKVGRKPVFTAADVVAAAVAEGLDGFTLSAVAQRLGVVTAAIYRLFPSRDDLVVACLDTAAATLRTPAADADWRAALRLWADECWRVCEEYPGLNRLVYSYPTAFTRIDHVLGQYAEVLGRSGRTPGQAMFALDFIGDTVFASHLGVESMRASDESGDSGLDRVRGALDDGAALKPQDSWADRGFVDKKVDFIIGGLERDWPEL